MRSGFVSVGETEIRYQIGGEGPAILFIHAGVADSRMWRDQMELPGHTSITFDQRGYGETKWVPGPYANRDDAVAVLDHLDIDEAVVVGCSNGAEAALQLAVSAKDRAQALVLLGAAAAGWTPTGGWGEEPFWGDIVAAYDVGDYGTVVRLEAGLWLAGPNRPIEDVDPELVALFEAMDLIPQPTERERDRFVVPFEPASNERLDEVGCPTLVIVGEHDLSDLIESAHYLASRLSKSEAVILADTAHLPSLERPTEFNAALTGFLAS